MRGPAVLLLVVCARAMPILGSGDGDKQCLMGSIMRLCEAHPSDPAADATALCNSGCVKRCIECADSQYIDRSTQERWQALRKQCAGLPADSGASSTSPPPPPSPGGFGLDDMSGKTQPPAESGCAAQIMRFAHGFAEVCGDETYFFGGDAAGTLAQRVVDGSLFTVDGVDMQQHQQQQQQQQQQHVSAGIARGPSQNCAQFVVPFWNQCGEQAKQVWTTDTVAKMQDVVGLCAHAWLGRGGTGSPSQSSIAN